MRLRRGESCETHRRTNGGCDGISSFFLDSGHALHSGARVLRASPVRRLRRCICVAGNCVLWHPTPHSSSAPSSADWRQIVLGLRRLQELRNFDPDTVLVSVRARTFERLPRTVLRIARSECRRRQDVVVLVFQLQAHAIPPSDRAFVRASTQNADGSHAIDSYESRADISFVTEVLPLYVDELGPLDADDLLAGGLSLQWFGPAIPAQWCDGLHACEHTQCAGSNALHDIIVFVGAAANCCYFSGDERWGNERAAARPPTVGAGDRNTEDGCREAVYIQKRYLGRKILVMQPGNVSSARAHLASTRRGRQHTEGVEQQGKAFEAQVDGGEPMAREVLTSAKVLVIGEVGGGGESVSGIQHALEAMALGGPALVVSDAVVASSPLGSEVVIDDTNALVYKAGDLDGLGHQLDRMLVSEEVGGWDGGRLRCELREGACWDACARHNARSAA